MAPRLNFLPDALSRTLLEFQQEGVLFGISKNGRCLIGDEMGLGKTLQALSIAYYYKNEWPLLIVCPSSMCFPWIEEIEKWLPDIQPHELNLVQSGIDASNIKTSKISIVGYGLLSHSGSRLLINCLKEMRFGVVIVDESHYMKNRKAARTKALISVIKQAKRAVLLTGTPALARPEELYVQVDVLKPNLLGAFNRFANRYCDAHTEHVCGGKIRNWNTQGASNLEELHDVLKTNVMIRRLKRHVLTQLPAKRRQRITFDLAESEAKKQLGEVIEEFRSACKQIKGSSSSQSQPAMDTNPLFEMKRLATVLYKQTGLSKITAVRQYIADILDNSDKKFLVFAHHVDVMKAIEQEVVKRRVKYIKIAGDVRSVLRGSLVHQFQTDSSTRVAILSILAASMGITLTAADHIIFSELHWTPGVMQQAEDRVHRIGQENSVLVQYLVARGTIDEVLWRMLCTKIYVTSMALNGKLQGLDVEEGSESQSKLLEAFSAWVMEDEDDGVPEDDFLFTHSQKKRKQDVLQRSLTEFFHSPSTTKCRKIDSGKEWSESQDSSTRKEQDCEAVEKEIQATPEPKICIIVDSESDEDSSLRKTTKKTYKLGKRKSLEMPGETTTVQASESQEIAWEFAREITKIDADESSKPASAEVVDMLSSYTRLLNKSSKSKGRNLEDASKGNNVDGVIELVAKSERENSSNLVENSKELGKLVADSKESVGNGCPSENSVQTVGSVSSVVEQNNIVIIASDCTSKNHSYFTSNPMTSASISTVVKTSTSGQTIDDVTSEVKETGPMSLTPNSALDKPNDCSKTSPIARRELAIDSGNFEVKQNKPVPTSALDKHDCTSDSKPIAARRELMVDSVESQGTQTKPVPLAPTSAEDRNDFKTWCCSLCTFNNTAFLRVCEMCDTPRYKSRRKSMNTKCSTDEFVARKQLKILEQCSGVDQRNSGRKNGRKRSKKSNKASVAVSRGNEESDGKRTEDKTDLSVVANGSEQFTGSSLSVDDSNKIISAEHLSESKPEIPVKPEIVVEPEISVKHEIPVKPEIPIKPEMPVEHEIPVKPEIPVKHEIAVKPKILVKPVETYELDTSDVDLFASVPLNEFWDEIMTTSREDELMTSSCEDEIMTSPCEPDTATENPFGTESEFDDITDDDWWVCTSCKNYNYDDAADQCETCGLKKPSDCFEDLVTGLEDDDCWRCEDCGEFNFGDDVIRKCTKCCHGDKKDQKSLVEQYKNLSHLIVDDEGLDGTIGTPDEGTREHIGKPEVIENLMFRLSSYTDRVFLYDGDGDPLNCNVNILEMEGSDTGNVPALLAEPSNRKQILRFARQWKSLKQRNRRMIKKAGVIFDDPYEALEAIKKERKLCTSRFPSKEKLQAEVLDAAQAKNGTVRHCVKPKGRKTGGCSVEEDVSGTNDQHTRWIQAVDENGRPLCLSCKGLVDTKNTNCLWDERFCSHKCKELYQCRISGTRVRQQLFEDEKGVCQKCGCDAHELYRTIKLLPKADRRSYLENTPFISLPVSLLNKIIVDPKEGMFWEADHVVAVAEGGGECDLENYRTLCVPCHRQVTAELRERLRTSRRKRRIAGVPDITSFFCS